MPKIVVMMAAKNAERYILQAVGSSLKSLPRDSELVIWNDASTDATLSKVESIQDRRITVINSDVSVGSGAARSEIIGATDSEYVACMDADDICLPWRFKAQLSHIKTVDASFMNGIKYGPNKYNMRPSLSLHYNANEVNSALLFHNPIVHSTFFAKRSIVEDAGGYRSLRVAQDYDLWLRLAMSGAKMGILARPGVIYRKNAGQISSTENYVKRIQSQDEIIQSYKRLLGHILREFGAVPHEPDLSQIKGLQSPEITLQMVFGNFRPLLRLYYQRLLRNDRLGPLNQ